MLYLLTPQLKLRREIGMSRSAKRDTVQLLSYLNECGVILCMLTYAGELCHGCRLSPAYLSVKGDDATSSDPRKVDIQLFTEALKCAVIVMTSTEHAQQMCSDCNV